MMDTERLAELLSKFKNDTISDEEKEELLAELSSYKAERKLKALCLAHGFTQTDYDRLRRVMAPSYREREVDIDGIIRGVERRHTARFTREQAEMIWNTGEYIYQNWGEEARNKKMKLDEYAKNALLFYFEHGDRVDELVQENNQLKAVCEMLVEACQPIFIRLAAMRIYTTFLTDLIYFRSMGIEIPIEEVVKTKLVLEGHISPEFRQTIERLINENMQLKALLGALIESQASS